ncbi:hypothetical protein TNCV_5511 [Trichonephila clavipes]|nr:hypothetical protein TNCV_5511 [Trichonephila clavipes]
MGWYRAQTVHETGQNFYEPCSLHRRSLRRFPVFHCERCQKHFPGLLGSLGWQVGQPTSFVELEVHLHQLWNGMSQDIIWNLYVSNARSYRIVHSR